MRKALIVGIDYYDHINSLNGCVRDAENVKSVLARNGDYSVNFDVHLVKAWNSSSKVDRRKLKDDVDALFKDDNDVALFYFSGHGYISSTGGYLLTSECKEGDDGLSLNEVLSIANKSAAKNKIVIIDACHSGIMGNPDVDDLKSEITEGMTILTASGANQYAIEENGSGIFTNLFVDALEGAAADLVGNISPGSVYAHVDQSLGAWEQRPVFKTNVKTFTYLRKVEPPIPLDQLRKIIQFFPSKDFQFSLDPSYEPERSGTEPDDVPDPIRKHTDQFKILQKFNRVNLVKPVGAPHMWHAAMESKTLRLTALGEHYRGLAAKSLI